MPDPTMQELLDQLQSQNNRSRNQAVLIDALRTYDEQTKRFRQLQGRKKLPLVTARDKTQLMELHKAIGVAAESVLGDKDEPEALREIVKKITALSSGSYNALLQYDPAKTPKTLSSLEEDVRTLTIHQGNVVLGGADALGGVQSERAPLSFLDSNGNRVSGLFTKKKLIEPEKLFDDAFKHVTEAPLFNVRADAEAVLWLQDNFYDVLRKSPEISSELGPDASDGEYLTALVDLCEEDGNDGKHHINPDKLKFYVGKALSSAGEYHADSLRDDAWEQLAEGMTPMIVPLCYAHQTAKIPFGGRIDNRNAAMSAVADLLGMPKVIARSKPMRIIDKDGNVVEGTFMEASKGLDPENLPKSARNIKPTCLDGTDGKGFKDIANLQILDYICGNFDRHGANMHYQFDKNGKLCGVQGIDNDSCLGVLTNKELKHTGENYIRMTNLSNLKVIPKETRDRVMALDPSTLKYTLRGYGLTEKELNAAGQRLENMQTYIRKAAEKDVNRKKDQKYLRVMSDSDFKSATFASLSKPMRSNNDLNKINTFTVVGSVAPNLAEYCREQKKKYKDLKDATEVGMDNRAERHIPGRERLKGSALETMLNKRTWSAWTSENYINMQRAAKNYVNVYKTIENRLKQANDAENKRSAGYQHEKEAVVSEADLEQMKNASVRLREASWTYLTGKMPGLREWELDGQQPIPYPAGASDYTKSRIDAAVSVYQMAKQGDEIKPVETQTAKDNEKEALAAQQRRMKERGQEQKDLQADRIVAI